MGQRAHKRLSPVKGEADFRGIKLPVLCVCAPGAHSYDFVYVVAVAFVLGVPEDDFGIGPCSSVCW